ncbi:antibiotic biosynthesis monooxygenase [Actinomadura sp. WMMB 499]|uniref:antibiotic biosynthesis monooxygenase n=1 Tax=Actinomadura sp. WMMB 499 TaxID=1219491 RepID=UPI0012442692|nr:antibiotic biosynthesis monooxygenase [Actinomadura sp. WMMB 499]QFG24429.1 antibiotic biosynthesis monooxygenase [Actinomadura sp. WMMB 499]
MGQREPVTVVFTWDVRPGRERAFERWADAIHDVASRYPGHAGAMWLRAEGARHRYYTVVRFDDQDSLDAWLDSPERRDLVARLDGLAEERLHHTTGLETWFSLPGEAVPAPSRLKMIVVTFCAVYPLSILLQTFVTPLAQDWPLPLKAVLFPAIVVPVLTLLIMPALSRLLRRWLYPVRRTHRAARPGH